MRHDRLQLVAGVLPMVRELGERLNARPAEEPQPIVRPIARLTRTDVWPPEVLAEIRRIYSGEEE